METRTPFLRPEIGPAYGPYESNDRTMIPSPFVSVINEPR